MLALCEELGHLLTAIGQAEAAGTLHKNSTVEDNVIMTCDDDGMQIEGGGENVRIRNNTISGCLIGIAIASPQTGPTYVEGNVISGLLNACYKVGNGPGTGVTYLTGNRCTGPKGMQQTDPNHSSLVLRQNCWQVGGYIFELPYGPTSGLDFDEDVMYSTGPPFKWNGGVTYGSLAAFQSATGQEQSGTWQQSSDCSVLGPPTQPSTKVGDINGDSSINILDLSVLLTKWGTSDTMADLDKSGKVDIIDLSILLTKWGT